MQNLPRITFILGKNTAAKTDLYDELVKLNQDVLPILFNDVIDEIARSIFFSGASRRPDWRVHRVKLLDGEVDMKLWWGECEDFLRDCFGSIALGAIALHTLIASGDIDTYDNFIVPDVVAFTDITPFHAHFKPEELLIIILASGLIFSPLPGVKTIILANETDVAEQLLQIDRELSPVRPATEPPEQPHGKS